MPVIRDPALPQINAGQLLYGAMPIELLPDGTAPLQFPIWDGVQWRLVAFVAQAGIDIELDVATNTLSIVNEDYRVAATFTADAIFRRTVAGTLTANAILLKTATATFTANSVIRGTIEGTFTADAVLV